MVEQEMRFSNAELDLLKKTFAEDTGILKSIRKIMLQLPISEEKETALRNIINAEVMKIVRKIFMPEIDGDAPIHQVASLWFKTANEIRNKVPEESADDITIMRALIVYINQQLDDLETGKRGKIKLKDYENFSGKTDLLIWSDIIHFVEAQLDQIRLLAGQKSETPEETIDRLKKDSSK